MKQKSGNPAMVWGNGQESSFYASAIHAGAKTLHEKVRDLVQSLKVQSNAIDMSPNKKQYWIAQGQQTALRQAAAQLTKLCRQHQMILGLRLALRDFLRCGEKCQIDAEDTVQAPYHCKENQSRMIQRWRAMGELLALDAVHQEVERLVVDDVCEANLWYLSLDGMKALFFKEDETVEMGADRHNCQQNEVLFSDATTHYMQQSGLGDHFWSSRDQEEMYLNFFCGTTDTVAMEVVKWPDFPVLLDYNAFLSGEYVGCGLMQAEDTSRMLEIDESSYQARDRDTDIARVNDTTLL